MGLRKLFNLTVSQAKKVQLVRFTIGKTKMGWRDTTKNQAASLLLFFACLFEANTRCFVTGSTNEMVVILCGKISGKYSKKISIRGSIFEKIDSEKLSSTRALN